jgi:hypothetical protein
MAKIHMKERAEPIVALGTLFLFAETIDEVFEYTESVSGSLQKSSPPSGGPDPAISARPGPIPTLAAINLKKR